jgi:hypothetical protein
MFLLEGGEHTLHRAEDVRADLAKVTRSVVGVRLIRQIARDLAWPSVGHHGGRNRCACDSQPKTCRRRVQADIMARARPQLGKTALALIERQLITIFV